MAVQPPPYAVARTVEAWSPGFWREFITSANRALRPTDVLTSWWRSPGYNAMVGGREGSQHLAGTAFDARPYWNSAAARASLVSRLRGAGFIAVDEGNHVHAQAWPAGALARSGLLRALPPR